MTIYKITRKSQSWYGESIGILILDAAYPCIPGNVGNATTYDFPVRYQEVPGATIDTILHPQGQPLQRAFIKAAAELRDRGVKAITGACGFMAYFQEEVAAAVDIPVFLSSLMQIPFIHAMTNRRVGIITANSECLTPRHFEASRVSSGIPLAVAGLQDQPEFRGALLEERGTLDSTKMEGEVVDVARKMVESNPDVGAILLECSDLPPFAHAVQAATGKPVFDFNTMINYVQASVARRPYAGAM